MLYASERTNSELTALERVCHFCSAQRGKPTHREYGYRERRGWVIIERWWECTACGHRIPADNEGLRLTPPHPAP